MSIKRHAHTLMTYAMRACPPSFLAAARSLLVVVGGGGGEGE